MFKKGVLKDTFDQHIKLTQENIKEAEEKFNQIDRDIVGLLDIKDINVAVNLRYLRNCYILFRKFAKN